MNSDKEELYSNISRTKRLIIILFVILVICCILIIVFDVIILAPPLVSTINSANDLREKINQTQNKIDKIQIELGLIPSQITDIINNFEGQLSGDLNDLTDSVCQYSTDNPSNPIRANIANALCNYFKMI